MNQTLQQLYTELNSKNKQVLVETSFKITESDPEIDNEFIKQIVEKLEIDNKPIVISTTCKLITNLVRKHIIDKKHYITLIPAISPLCLEIKKEINESSLECITEIYNSVKNRDIEELIPELIATIKDPSKTIETIDKLSSTKFVTIVDAKTISIICPLLLRGYSLRKDNISRLCSKIIVNMLKLVDNYEEVQSFIPIITPVVKNIIDTVSDPEARNTINSSLKELGKIESLKDANNETIVEESRERLCSCDFTLAYGNTILLKNTYMTLYKGCKYGLIGESGKTTLMSAISENKVDGFPDVNEVKCVFVQTDIIGERSHLSCVDYVLQDLKIQELGFTKEQVVNSLLQFEFGNSETNSNSPAQVDHNVSTLSGGWRMKLALAKSMLINPDILLLESPTDHLDVINIEWIQDYIHTCDKTVIFTSQSKETLNKCCTHIIQIKSYKLKISQGNLDNLISTDPDVEEYFRMDKTNDKEAIKFTFPEPGILEGVKSRTKAIIKMDNCTFTYPNNTKPTIEDVSFHVSLSSRVGVCGKNGEGKSTAIKLLTGENIPQVGTVYKHPSVRLGYLAQHSFETIDDHPTKTANEYIRWRFEIPGEDREAIKKKTTTLNEQEESLMKNTVTFQLKNEDDKLIKISGVVDSLTGLRKKEKDGSFSYQVKFSGKSDDSNIYVPLRELEKANEVCFRKLVNAVDEKIAAMAGLYIKPLTRKNVEDHLALIGLEPELASHTKLSQLSDGEKVKVVLGACMWLNPHVIVFDEPTNSLSWDSLVALVGAIKEFQGGVVIISHNQDFVDEVCNEIWLMKKDSNTGIAHLSISGGETNDMKVLLEKKEEPTSYIDASGNEVAIIKKKKATKQDIKKLKKKITALRKAGEEVWTDEELEKLGLEL